MLAPPLPALAACLDPVSHRDSQLTALPLCLLPNQRQEHWYSSSATHVYLTPSGNKTGSNTLCSPWNQLYPAPTPTQGCWDHLHLGPSAWNESVPYTPSLSSDSQTGPSLNTTVVLSPSPDLSQKVLVLDLGSLFSFPHPHENRPPCQGACGAVAWIPGHRPWKAGKEDGQSV